MRALLVVALLTGICSAAPCPDAASCASAGAKAAAANDDAAALDAFTRACNLGDGLSCVHLGQTYAKADADKWLHRAVALFDQGCTKGRGIDCYWLGISRENGVGIELDEKRSLALYHRACALGHIGGCTNEAGQYLTGKGVAKDAAKAEVLYEHACDQADLYACYWVGHILDGELALPPPGQTIHAGDVDVKVVDAKAPSPPPRFGSGPALKALVSRAPPTCDAAHPGRCYLLGVRAIVSGHAADAAASFEHACELGSGWGCFALGDLTLHGVGVPTDLGKAAGLYRKVCAREVGGDEGFEAECNAITDRLGL